MRLAAASHRAERIGSDRFDGGPESDDGTGFATAGDEKGRHRGRLGEPRQDGGHVLGLSAGPNASELPEPLTRIRRVPGYHAWPMRRRCGGEGDRLRGWPVICLGAGAESKIGGESGLAGPE